MLTSYQCGWNDYNMGRPARPGQGTDYYYYYYYYYYLAYHEAERAAKSTKESA
jgi:hypothetical protein